LSNYNLLTIFLNAHMTPDLNPDSDIDQFPGFLIRRVHQIAVARFSAQTDGHQITPVQWAALRRVQAQPGIDQSALARGIALDTSTIAGVVERLELRGLLLRKPSPTDRRLRTLYLTPEGLALTAKVTDITIEVQNWLLEPLSELEQAQLKSCLRKVIDRHLEDPSASEA